jgi:hypothetical protein
MALEQQPHNNPLTYEEILRDCTELNALFIELQQQHEKRLTEVEQRYRSNAYGDVLGILQAALTPPTDYEAITFENPANAAASSHPNDPTKKTSFIYYVDHVINLTNARIRTAQIFTEETIKTHQEQLSKIRLLLIAASYLYQQLQACIDESNSLSDIACLQKNISDLYEILKNYEQEHSSELEQISNESMQEMIATHLSKTTQHIKQIAEEFSEVMAARENDEMPPIFALYALPSVQATITYEKEWAISFFEPPYRAIIEGYKGQQQTFQSMLDFFSQTPPSAETLSNFTTQHIALIEELINKMLTLISDVDKRKAQHPSSVGKKSLEIFNERLVEFLNVLQKSQAEVLARTTIATSNPGHSPAAFLSPTSSSTRLTNNSSYVLEKPSSTPQP